MGTLAQTLGKDLTVTVEGCKIAVRQLSIDELYDCMREGFHRFETPPENIDEAAQSAIETGRTPLPALSIIIAKACPTLDADDVAALMSTGNLDKAYEVAAASMGLEYKAKSAADETASDDGKKNE